MEQLKELFYNPKTGYTGLKELQRKSEDAKIKLTNAQIKKWYFDQPVNQIYYQKQKVKQYNPIVPVFPQPGTCQMDLMDLSRFASHNRNYKFIFNVIDVYSRYAWSFPLKRKVPHEIAPKLESILKQLHAPICFTFDKGSEFKGDVLRLLEKYNVTIFLNDPYATNAKNKVGMIERFNRTLLNKIKKYMQYNQTLTYFNVLNDIVENYNNTIHSSIHQTPSNVFHNRQRPIINLNNSLKVERNYQFNHKKLNVGDSVRFLRVRKTFDKKSFEPVYSTNLYKIVGLRGNQYLLDNKRYYYGEQLIKGTQLNESFEKLLLKNKKQNKEERELKQEFKKPIEEIKKQIVQGKRIRKPNPKYNII
jgi:hypothetical protein